MATYGQRSINGSVEWLGIPAPFCNTGVAWTDNLLVSEALWVEGVRVGYWAWGNQPGIIIGVDILWRGVVPACVAYLPRSSPENACATARRVRDARLWEHHLARAQNVFYDHHIGSDKQFNWLDDDWHDIWDEPADE